MGFKAYPGPAAWRADDFTDNSWVNVLSREQKRELTFAAQGLPDDEHQWLAMSRDNLDLPALSPLFDAVTAALEQGRGFVLLRGIDLSRDDVDFAYRVNWILATALGEVIAQNANGEVIGAVTSVVEASDNGLETRGYVSNAELRFHCDGGDVATLLCVRQAPEGGSSALASMQTIHITMIEECPEQAQTLYDGLSIYMHKVGNLAGRTMPKRPVFFPQEDHLLSWANLRLMELPYEASGKQMPGDQRAALDAFEEIAERRENKLTFKLQPGDMLLVHNNVCLHKRSSFTDDPDPDKKRLMLRLWYNVPGGRAEAVTPKDRRKGYFTQNPYVIRHR